MKIKHDNVIIEIDDEERQLLKVMMLIVEDICNDAVRNETLSPVLTRAGLVEPREAGGISEVASALREEL